MEIGQNPRLARFDHMLAETGKIAGASAAGIDKGRHPARAGNGAGVDSKRGSAPVDVGVEVDEARRDDSAGNVAHDRAAVGREVVADGGDAAPCEGDVGDTVEPL